MPRNASENEIDLDFLRTCLRQAGELAISQRGEMETEVKPDHTPVTNVDHQVEDFIIHRISTRYPGHRILSEESGLHPAQSTYTWIIDPIDGTRSFAAGLPIWGVSIGILRDGEPYAGGLFLPVTGEMYWGNTQQAFYNSRQMPRLASVDPDNVLAFLAVPSNVHLGFRITYPRIRSMGSTAAHLAYAAMGAAVGVLTHRVGLWDIAGMLPLLEATGVHITLLSSKPFHASDMLDGSMAPEPFLVAHPSVLDLLRNEIEIV